MHTTELGSYSHDDAVQLRFEHAASDEGVLETQAGIYYNTSATTSATSLLTTAEDAYYHRRTSCTSYDAEGVFPYASKKPAGQSLWLTQQYGDKRLTDEFAPAIKVKGNTIIDGNRGCIAGRILGQEPAIQPWAGGRGPIVSWDQIKISIDW